MVYLCLVLNLNEETSHQTQTISISTWCEITIWLKHAISDSFMEHPYLINRVEDHFGPCLPLVLLKFETLYESRQFLKCLQSQWKSRNKTIGCGESSNYLILGRFDRLWLVGKVGMFHPHTKV